MVMTSTERSRKRRRLMTRAQRTAEHTYFASKRRVDLVRILNPAGRCGACGRRVPHRLLVVDHINGRYWFVEDVSASVRVARYWREHLSGIPLRAVCARCSAVMGGGIRYHGARVRS